MTIHNTYCSFVNLDHRTDRLAHMNYQLNRIGLEATRTPGMMPNLFPYERKTMVMRNRTPGAIGCHYSQVSIMERALSLNMNALVMEDDLVFCQDFEKRMGIIQDFMNANEWDIFWLGGTYHHDHYWHKSVNGRHINRDLRQCNCRLNRDYEPTNHSNIVRTYGCFSTFAYIVNVNSLRKVLDLLEQNVHLSMGIDWLFILLQPQLKTFAFNPGCVKQIDNQSDIGTGITMFSGFSKLGKHWYQDLM